MDELDITREFLIESKENLARLDVEIVKLEQDPKNAGLLDSIFRTIHTLKGTGGMLCFSAIEGVAHLAESLLSRVRNGECELSSELVSLILRTVDVIKGELDSIEAAGKESGVSHESLRAQLKSASEAIKANVAPRASEETAHSSERTADPDCPAPQKLSSEDSTIRVDVVLLDRLMNLVGELVLARNQILQSNTTQKDATLNASSQRLNLITTELQEGVMKTRMQPIGVIWNKLPRVVRDLAASSGKSILLQMEGAETELDRTIIEAIKDPLTHLVRNCCDHGIEKPKVRAQNGKPEQGTISLRAYHEGGQVNIEISDDGAGIDLQRLREKATEKGLARADRMSDREITDLIFLPGLSTAEKITNISGRGVGMDVVKTNIEKISGAVDVTSQLGHGTTFKIKIPLTLAIIPGLIVTSGGERFVIPQVSLLELIGLDGEPGKTQVESVGGTPVYRRRGKLLPLVYLNRVLQMAGRKDQSDSISIVVLQAEGQQFGLVVDGISDTQEIVVKPLGKHLKGLSCYAGACIMGDGSVALILDVMGIAQRANVSNETSARVSADKNPGAADSGTGQTQVFLLFAGPDNSRMALPLDRVARLEELPVAQVENAGNQWVAQYRGQILPLINLEVALDERRRQKRHKTENPCSSAKTVFQVVVCNHLGYQVGLLVENILDIVEDTAEVRFPASRTGVLHSAVISGKITEVIDIPAVLQAAQLKFTRSSKQATAGAEAAR
ncbi:MAG: chemotaxis protein CheW [Terriglobales bacterium]